MGIQELMTRGRFLFRLLPKGLRQSRWWTALSFRLHGIRSVENFEELDRLSGEIGHPTAPGAAETLLKMGKLTLKVPARLRMPTDPFSAEYARRQTELYAHITGKAYDVKSEMTSTEADQPKDTFFPYDTHSCRRVGDELLLHGFLIRNMEINPGAKIVEFGAGVGNATWHLAMTGCDMTAVEVNKGCAALIRHRAARYGRTVRVFEQDMVEFAETTAERFDAALFVASLHHCHDHLRLLRALHRVVKDDGAIYFAQEHVVPRSPALPYPWGLFLDGASLFFIRRFGWLEQGFEETYFRRALEKTGWQARRIPSSTPGVEDLYVARKRQPV